MKRKTSIISFYTFFFILCFFVLADTSFSQYAYKWMSVGSLHNFYVEIGSEREEAIQTSKQQNGLQWPAIYAEQDIQCAKALWIGCTNFSSPGDPQSPYNYKVVHVGPRVTGAGEFFPQEFKMIGKFEAPQVFVDGDLSYDKTVEIDEVDPNLNADRMIVNTVNTQIGITMTRKIFQFGQEYHDNYIVTEYTFKNTGNADEDADIELPSTTLTGVYFYFHYRLAVCRNAAFAVGNAAQWGINSMLDVKTMADPEKFRAQYMWHGKYPPFTTYDNIGAPIWSYPGDGLRIEKSDTVGRLGAIQFAGVVTLHADVSAADKNDDLNQPSTTSYEGSDETNTSNNDSYNKVKMESEYGWMSKGRVSPTHALKVEPTGLPGFIQPTGDPALGTPGGFSNADGYGPYTLAPGESIKIILAEAVSGIARDSAVAWGREYKQEYKAAGTNTTLQAAANLKKNTRVFLSRDSLFQTFRRAIANYESGYNIPKPPLPPKLFNVNGLGDRISMSWDTYADPGSNLEGFEIYRAVGKYDSNYTLIHTAGPNDRSFDDPTPVRGLNYFYYIVSVSSESANTGAGLTPAGKLRSSRYYTQAYNPAVLKRQAGTNMNDIRVVPNPYNISASKELGYGDLALNRLYFFNIPGKCNIKIYSELGELVETIEHTDGSGDQAWDSLTSSGQIVVSGIYIAVIENLDTGENKIVKFVIIR
jgi:hypothetical protein